MQWMTYLLVDLIAQLKFLFTVYLIITSWELLSQCQEFSGFLDLLLIKMKPSILSSFQMKKIHSLEPLIIYRLRRKQFDGKLNYVGQSAFISINGSLAFLGMANILFAAFACSHLQQSDGEYIVKHLFKQSNMIKFEKRLRTTSSFVRPWQNGAYQISVIVYGDAARPSHAGQLGIVGDLMISLLEKSSYFHPLVWSSLLSKWLVSSIASVVILAAGNALDEGKIVVSTCKRLS